MSTMTFSKFRRNASRVLDLVERGESVRILRHGRTIARIIPEDSQEKMPAWKRPGLRLVETGASLSKAVLAERRASR